MPTPSSYASRPKLSVAMIVRDEARTIEDALASVRSIADEIVVLDTGSSDQTVTLVEAAGAKVCHAPWNDDFALARNTCLQQVRGDWVLWLDGSEQLDETTAQSLRTFVDREADRGHIYTIMVEIPSLDPAGSAEQAACIRLMPNDPDLRFTGRVCESVRPAAEQSGMELDMAPGRIIRQTTHNDPRRRSAKARRNLELVALVERESGWVGARHLIARGDAYSALECFEPARAAYRAAIAASELGSTEMLDAYYGLLPTFDQAPNRREEQLKTCLQALESYPLDGQLLLAMGNYMQMRDRLDLARRSFEAAVNFGQVDLSTWHLKELAEVTSACLSVIQQLEGSDDAARATLDAAMQRHPSSARVRHHLLDLHVRHGNETDALRVAQSLPREASDREPFENAIRGACRAALQQWTPALGYLQASYVAGFREPMCLRWLAITLLSNGRFEAARPVLAEWAEMEPQSAELRGFLAALDSQSDVTETSEMSGESRQYRLDSPDTSINVAPAHTTESGTGAPESRASTPTGQE